MSARRNGYHNRNLFLPSKINNLFCSLKPSTYTEVAPKIGFWIEYALAEHSTTVDDLVQEVSLVAWSFYYDSFPSAARFLKEFRDTPNRSEQAKLFVDELCPHVLRWFAAASAENLSMNRGDSFGSWRVTVNGGEGFINAASFVGYLVEWGLLSNELVQRHLIKPLVAHQYYEGDRDDVQRSIRAMAIFRLFAAARNSLLQGLLDPEDVQACFKTLDAKITLEGMAGPDPTKLNELREFHATWLKQREEELRGTARIQEPTGKGTKHVMSAGVPVETHAAFVPENPPAAVADINTRFSALRSVVPSPSDNVGSPSETCVDIPSTAISSPALSVSTISDLTSTELGDTDHGEGSENVRHDTFYFGDGDVEITCGGTAFRVHSSVISFSSSKLRDILSPTALANAPTPGWCPRITTPDTAEDFVILLKMIYTPEFPARNKVPSFTTFASLLRMTTKYGFSLAREGLIEDLRGAYPTKWEDFERAETVGEDVFGSPKPHPNAVLNLFLEHKIKFALPFAAYRAGLGGPSALVGELPGTVLSRSIIASILNGMGEIRRMMTHAAHSIAYVEAVCPQRVCASNAGAAPLERIEALRKISDVMVKKSEGDVLSPFSLGNLLCADCERLLKNGHRNCCKQHVWARLPSLLGWESWEGI